MICASFFSFLCNVPNLLHYEVVPCTDQGNSTLTNWAEQDNITGGCWDYQMAVWLEDRPENQFNRTMWQIYLALSQFIMRVVPTILIASLNIWMFIRLRSVLKKRYSHLLESSRPSINVRLSQAWQAFSDRVSISSRRYTMNSSISSLVTQVWTYHFVSSSLKLSVMYFFFI